MIKRFRYEYKNLRPFMLCKDAGGVLLECVSFAFQEDGVWRINVRPVQVELDCHYCENIDDLTPLMGKCKKCGLEFVPLVNANENIRCPICLNEHEIKDLGLRHVDSQKSSA